MIDTHCHLYDQKLNHKIPEILENAKKANIVKMICIGDTLDTSDASIQISEQYQNIYASVGIHPHESKDAPDNYVTQIKNKASHHKVVAIGEIGLDYHYNFSDPVIQKKVFLNQLKLAKELNMPAIIHCRDADEDLYNTIIASNHTKGVIHCFASNLDFANKLIDLGYYISFTGMITFVKELNSVVKSIDIKNIMIETDSPYLAPIPYRGKTNQPAYVAQVAEKISEIKKMDLQDVIKITSKNAHTLFEKLL